MKAHICELQHFYNDFIYSSFFPASPSLALVLEEAAVPVPAWGGYSLPLEAENFGEQVHHSDSGTEERTEGTWEPQPRQDLPAIFVYN